MTNSAASEFKSEERTPKGGRSLEEFLLKGLYYEFIAIPCNFKYTMPLGIYNGVKPIFTVYREAGLYKILRGSVRELFLLAPHDPIVFYESLVHKLESRIEWGDDDCPKVSEFLGCWFKCYPTLILENRDYDIYECSKFTHVAGVPPPYSRVMGCLVELLVIYTKVKAGVIREGYLDYAKWLRWCIEKASRGDFKYVSTADFILQDLERVTWES